MASKRAPAKPTAPASSTSPLMTAALMAGAIGLGLASLVSKGRLSWPPTQLLSNLLVVAGCFAMVGPVLLATRKSSGEGGLGELLWMAGGLLVWVFNLAAIVRGNWRATSWATPIDPQAMGLTILAVMVAGWRWRASGRDWSWTNVTGWLLGVYWVGMGLVTIDPRAALLATSR